MNGNELEITCPSCRNAISIGQNADEVTCGICSEHYHLTGHLCPDCHSYHDSDEFICSSCGTPLSRICQKCRHANWTGFENCTNCGESLDLFSQFAAQKGRSTADRLQEQMADAAALKQVEASASMDRMAKLMAIEMKRQEEAKRQDLRRVQQERKVVAIFGIAIAVFLVVIIVLAIIGSG